MTQNRKHNRRKTPKNMPQARKNAPPVQVRTNAPCSSQPLPHYAQPLSPELNASKENDTTKPSSPPHTVTSLPCRQCAAMPPSTTRTHQKNSSPPFGNQHRASPGTEPRTVHCVESFSLQNSVFIASNFSSSNSSTHVRYSATISTIKKNIANTGMSNRVKSK